MDAYTADYAELYDIFYADKPYAAEAAFVGECLRRHGRPGGRRLLEVACGTGRHATELSRRGYAVTATDVSAGMLAAARARAGAEDQVIEFRECDMRALDFPAGSFDAAMCLFDSIGYAVDDAGIGAALTGVRRALAPGGAFVFEFWHGPAMQGGFDPVRVRRWSLPQGREIVRISETQLRRDQDLAEVRYDVLDLLADGTYRRTRETHRNRYFTVPQMERLLRAAGLEPLTWHSGFSAAEPVRDATWHVVAVARAPGGGA